jgi:hypothetical protein
MTDIVPRQDQDRIQVTQEETTEEEVPTTENKLTLRKIYKGHLFKFYEKNFNKKF